MSEERLKLYLVQYDRVTYYVEAQNFGLAIAVWKRQVEKDWGDDYEDTDEPESVALIHDEPVIR